MNLAHLHTCTARKPALRTALGTALGSCTRTYTRNLGTPLLGTAFSLDFLIHTTDQPIKTLYANAIQPIRICYSRNTLHSMFHEVFKQRHRKEKFKTASAIFKDKYLHFFGFSSWILCDNVSKFDGRIIFCLFYVSNHVFGLDFHDGANFTATVFQAKLVSIH